MTDEHNTPSSVMHSNSLRDLDQNTILAAEFAYIASTASQANEDRARIASLFFMTVGTLIAAIFGVVFSPVDASVEVNVRLAFTILFACLFVHSLVTILELVRLRIAWVDSIRAMNTIKQHYSLRLAAANLDYAFRWNLETIPNLRKLNSISTLLAVQVATLGGVAAGSSVFFLGLALQNTWWPLSLGIAISAVSLQLFLYWRLLK